MSDKNHGDDGKKKARARKPYTKPVLRTYGTIRVITENIGSHTLNDAGTNPKIKTT
jgi:hypothetical protein